VKWIRFTAENAALGRKRADSTGVETALEHFQVKWIRFTAENAALGRKRAVSMREETALSIL
jgi:hypothetical protein